MGQWRGLLRARTGRQTEHLFDQGHHENLAADHGGHWVARKANHRPLAHTPGHQGFSWAHCDFVKRLLQPELGRGLRHQVIIAHRGATNGQDQISITGQGKDLRQGAQPIAGNR